MTEAQMSNKAQNPNDKSIVSCKDNCTMPLRGCRRQPKQSGLFGAALQSLITILRISKLRLLRCARNDGKNLYNELCV